MRSAEFSPIRDLRALPRTLRRAFHRGTTPRREASSSSCRPARDREAAASPGGADSLWRPVASGPRTALRLRGVSFSLLMSMRQPVSVAASRTFWPFLPIASDSCLSSTTTSMTRPPSSTIDTRWTFAGLSALVTNTIGSSEYSTMSIFSPRSSRMMAWTRVPSFRRRLRPSFYRARGRTRLPSYVLRPHRRCGSNRPIVDLRHFLLEGFTAPDRCARAITDLSLRLTARSARSRSPGARNLGAGLFLARQRGLDAPSSITMSPFSKRFAVPLTLPNAGRRRRCSALRFADFLKLPAWPSARRFARERRWAWELVSCPPRPRRRLLRFRPARSPWQDWCCWTIARANGSTGGWFRPNPGSHSSGILPRRRQPTSRWR